MRLTFEEPPTEDITIIKYRGINQLAEKISKIPMSEVANEEELDAVFAQWIASIKACLGEHSYHLNTTPSALFRWMKEAEETKRLFRKKRNAYNRHKQQQTLQTAERYQSLRDQYATQYAAQRDWQIEYLKRRAGVGSFSIYKYISDVNNPVEVLPTTMTFNANPISPAEIRQAFMSILVEPRVTLTEPLDLFDLHAANFNDQRANHWDMPLLVLNSKEIDRAISQLR